MSGITYNLHCPHCNKRYEITYGSSLLYTNRALIISSLHNGGRPLLEYLVKNKDILNKTFELLNNGYSLDFGYGHAMYYCPHCQKIYCKFSYQLIKDEPNTNSSIWEPPYKCWRCHHKLSKFEEKNFKSIKVTCICKNEILLDLKFDQNPELWS